MAKTMNGKLGIAGAFNRRRTLSPLQSCHSSSPNQDTPKESYSKILNENKVLKEKNIKLKADIQDLRSSLKQITSETSHESIDERRINLIKFQMIQLERQIAVMTEALGCRSEAILETENAMAWLADKLRSFLASEVRGPTVSIPRSDLTIMIEGLESSRIKLFKSIEKCSKEEVGKSVLLLNPFLNPKARQKESLSVLDIALDRMDFLNLQHVSQLESKLCNVYKELIAVHEQLENLQSDHLRGGNINGAEMDRLMINLLKSSIVVKDASDDLLALSLLCPSAPWPTLSKPVTKEVPVDRVIAALPQLPQAKKQEVVDVLKHSIGTCNHRYHLLEKEKSVLKDELKFHRSVYELQASYTTDLFEALRCGYSKFEDSAKNVICEPIQNMLSTYKRLKQSSSERDLKDFLLVIKENESQLSAVVEMFTKQDSGGSEAEAFAAYGTDLLVRLESIKQKCQKQRDDAIKAKRCLRNEQKQKDRELQHLIENLEAKYNKQWEPHSQIFNSELSNSKESLLENVDFDDTSKMTREEFPSSDVIFPSKSKTDGTVLEDPVVLRSYLDEDSDWVSVLDDSQTKPKESAYRTSRSKSSMSSSVNSIVGESEGCTSLMSDRSSISASPSKKQSKVEKNGKKWVPDKEWNNDFVTTPHIDSEDAQSSHENDVPDSKISLGGNEREISQQSRKSGQKMLSAFKSKHYEPNLEVCQTSLKLKKRGSNFSKNQSK